MLDSWGPAWLGGFSPTAPGLNPKHTSYAFLMIDLIYFIDTTIFSLNFNSKIKQKIQFQTNWQRLAKICQSRQQKIPQVYKLDRSLRQAKGSKLFVIHHTQGSLKKAIILSSWNLKESKDKKNSLNLERNGHELRSIGQGRRLVFRSGSSNPSMEYWMDIFSHKFVV